MSTSKSAWTLSTNNIASLATQEQPIQPYNDPTYKQISRDFQRAGILSGTINTDPVALVLDSNIVRNEILHLNLVTIIFPKII